MTFTWVKNQGPFTLDTRPLFRLLKVEKALLEKSNFALTSATWQKKLAGLLGLTPGTKVSWRLQGWMRAQVYFILLFCHPTSSSLPCVFLVHSQRSSLTWENIHLQIAQREGWWLSGYTVSAGKHGAHCQITGSPWELSPLMGKDWLRTTDFIWQWPIRSSNHFSRSRQDHPCCSSLCSV